MSKSPSPILFFILFFFFFDMSCDMQDLNSVTGIQPAPPAVEAWSTDNQRSPQKPLDKSLFLYCFTSSPIFFPFSVSILCRGSLMAQW